MDSVIGEVDSLPIYMKKFNISIVAFVKFIADDIGFDYISVKLDYPIRTKCFI